MRLSDRGRAAAGPAIALVLVASTLVTAAPASPSSSYLVVWAGDWNAGDARAGAPDLAIEAGADLAAGPDFLAVVDADPSSASYGKVVRTLPVSLLENEPHHMQYAWSPGDRIFAGGLFSDRTFVFDVDSIPDVRLEGVVEPLDTPCGSVPDAYWVLSDGTAYGTYMGGPNVAGDPRCNGGISNGFAGTPGSIVRISPDAKVLSETSAAGAFNQPHPNDAGRPAQCVSNPPLARPSCANPHGIQVREDLHVMITSDYAEPRNVPIDPVSAPDPNVFRDTVRVWDIRDRNRPVLHSVSVMPRGSMAFDPPPQVDARGVMGIMETTVTNVPQHRGAFAQSMCGGQIYYSADITVKNPMWRQVFDVSVAANALDPDVGRVQGCTGGGWLQTSPDDTTLFHTVIGRNARTLGPSDPGVPKMLIAIDIRSLVAIPPSQWTLDSTTICTIDTAAEVVAGGSEPSCPSVAGVVELADATTGGPHWGAIDNFSLSSAPGRLTSVTRIAVSNYFVGRSGLDGNHGLCMVDVAAGGSLSIDGGFRDEHTGDACVSFDRPIWPHGTYGRAKPHSMLFVTPP
ncbi:MAG TPA: hypothetical protein VM841_07025 [Actinomycetota bacterium]|nr:hypothetical protein [Actinomycetota bacterium]